MRQAATRNLRLLFGGAVALLLIVTAIFAPYLAPHDPLEQHLLDQLLPPAFLPGGEGDYFLGTDSLGRDLLSRLIYGARPAALVMTIGATASALIGVALGLCAGYFGGWPDRLVSRIVEIFMSFPPMLLAIVLAAVIGPGLGTVVFAIVVIGWTRFCRIVRGEVLVLREADFVMAAHAVGVSQRRILIHEILPNLLPLVTVIFGLEMGRAIVVEAILSFIGFSATDLATWGSIIADGRAYIYQNAWAMAFPILAIILAVLGLNSLGDGLRQMSDPVLRR